MTRHSPTRAVFPELYPPTTAPSEATSNAAEQPIPGTVYPPPQPEPSWFVGTMHNVSIAPIHVNVETGRRARAHGLVRRSGEQFILHCPVAHCLKTFVRATRELAREAWMAHLVWYTERREVHRQAPGGGWMVCGLEMEHCETYWAEQGRDCECGGQAC
jgi:hypothetical protein